MNRQGYIFPPEYYEFEREGQFLFFDPANFIWLKTDYLGRTVINGLTGSFDAAVAAICKATGGEPEHGAVYVDKWITRLLEIGFLHGAEYQRRVPTTVLAERPTHLYLHMTTRCNLRCAYCYNLDHRDSSRQIAPGQLDDFLQLVDEAAEIGMTMIRLTGGEALLNPDTLTIARRIKDHGMGTNLLSNGILVTPDLAREIAQTIDVVSISLDSSNATEHNMMRGRDTHAQVLKSIAMLKDAGVSHLHLNAVVTAVNKDSVFEFLEYAYDELGATEVTLAPSEFEISANSDETPLLLSPRDIAKVQVMEREFYRNRGRKQTLKRSSLWRCQCGAGNGVLSVEANGDVYPCQTMHAPELKCGNAFTDGLRYVMDRSERLQEVKTTTVATIPECRECAMRYICGGGCRMISYSHAGRMDVCATQYCESLFANSLERLWSCVDEEPQSSNRVEPARDQFVDIRQC